MSAKRKRKSSQERKVKTRSINMLPEEWDKLDSVVGKGNRSKAIRGFVKMLKEPKR